MVFKWTTATRKLFCSQLSSNGLATFLPRLVSRLVCGNLKASMGFRAVWNYHQYCRSCCCHCYYYYYYSPIYLFLLLSPICKPQRDSRTRNLPSSIQIQIRKLQSQKAREAMEKFEQSNFPCCYSIRSNAFSLYGSVKCEENQTK